jgi:hypothetical protein
LEEQVGAKTDYGVADIFSAATPQTERVERRPKQKNTSTLKRGR